ncbi:hypothetical protein U9M48_006279 [Paspalum notatum var. saurae]|uniref:Uncharacterized protein n=1 Tax=Paspalum notatum var. saurae TaxID=547442 RepID=A0AAQ3PU07_PASNO
MGRRRGGLLTPRAAEGHISGYYREALVQLPADEFPKLLTAGVCFGLLDPVSNIIVNTAMRASSPRRKKRKRSEQQMIEEEEVVDKKEALALVAKRSLHGLVAFLVSYFRYLDSREALRYLCLAKADLLVAVRLIHLDRFAMPSSSTTNHSSTRFNVALKCAAVSGKHPCPDTFSAIWLSLATSSPMDQRQQLIQLSSHPRIQELLRKIPLVHPQSSPRKQPSNSLATSLPMDQLSSRPRIQELLDHLLSNPRKQPRKVDVPFQVAQLAWSRIFLLLDTIHCLYLKAIARFPRGDLRMTHHRGLLKAGHCFGPMDDPVSNIILNTIWYDTAFPPQEEFLADMLLTQSLARTQARSACGLILFLCTRFPGLTTGAAVDFLLQAGANLHDAISRVQCEGHEASGSLEEAYTKAARATWHPEPEALAKLYTQLPHHLPAEVLSSLRTSDRSLTAEEVETISASLHGVLGSQTPHRVPKLRPQAARRVRHDRARFSKDHLFFRRIVDNALKSKDPPGYQLHVICGVNEKVADNGKHGYYDLKDGHPYCHINFLARPRGSPTATPTLFFAECSKDDDNTKVFCCCAVDPSKDDGRCCRCEKNGTPIVHPTFERYRGCDTDFVDMACEITMMTDELFSLGSSRTQVFWLKKQDSVYFDPRWDTELAEYKNKAEDADPENSICII